MQSLKNGVSLLFAGAGIGWLMGLSQSPVLHTVLSSLLTVVGGLAAVLVGLKPDHAGTSAGDAPGQPDESLLRKATRRASAEPLAWLIIGIALGAPAGIVVRAHAVLGPAPSQQIDDWVQASDLDKKEVARALLHLPSLSAPAGGAPGGKGDQASGVGLYGVSAETCEKIEAAAASGEPGRLAQELSVGSRELMQVLGALADDKRQDMQVLGAIRRLVCPG